MNDLDGIFAKLAKSGKNTVLKVDQIPDRSVIPSGSLSLDLATGIGGIPDNRVIQVAGAPNAGKTTLVFSIVRNALEMFPESRAVWLDMEGRIERDWVQSHIPDEAMRDRLYILWPKNVEEATDLIESIMEDAEGGISVMVFDSIGSAATKSEQEKSAEIGNFGGNAKAISRLARSIGPLCNKWRTLFIGINQVRMDLANKYVEWSFPGGMAWEHAQSLNIFLRASKAKDGKVFEVIDGVEKQVGTLVSVLIMKNSVGPANMKAEYWFYSIPNSRGFGIDSVEEVIRIATTLKVIDQKGAWFYHPSLPDGGRAQGRNSLVKAIRESPELLKTIQDQTKAAMRTADDLSGILESVDIDSIESHEETETAWMKSTYASS